MTHELADRLLPQAPQPAPAQLGAHWDGRGTDFAVFSEQAEQVELCLFDPSGRHELARLPMPDCVDGIWRGYLPGSWPGQLYGYRVYGPYEPKRGLRFNGHKLLLDPYARQLAGALQWHDSLYGYRVGSSRADLSFDRRDSASHVPKAVVTDDHYDWGNDHPPRVPWPDAVIYELHVRGFSKRVPGIGAAERGSFGALGHPRMIEYLQHLGVTAVELLPVHAFVRDHFLLERGLTNYWGYNTLGYFAPEPQYLSDGTLGQLKWAVQQLHAAGIEVILDVVYNHSCEGNELGPTLSLRGFGEAVYYRLSPDEPRHHVNDSGCGNTLNLSHPRTIQLVMDSLRYWVSEFHVDGFRFDQSASLAREDGGFDPGCGFFDALLQDPLLARVKLIVEPWDVGPGGYQLGRHPPRMAEWNDQFRDDVRRYWRGDAGMRGRVAGRLQASAELFDHHRRRPWASVNYVSAHDGFTLQDVVSYAHKRNEANGEDNRDGTSHNYSSSWGAEGEAVDEAQRALRDRIRRNLLASLLLAHGTPMLLAGDEFGQSQQGNNNAYCQDNEVAWLDWSLLEGERGRAMHEFLARLIALRRRLTALRAARFMHARTEPAPGLADSFWFDERGAELTEQDWHETDARLLGLRRAARNADGTVEVLLLLLNADAGAHRFVLPPPQLAYRRLLDTEQPQAPESEWQEPAYPLAAHSLALLAATLPAAAAA